MYRDLAILLGSAGIYLLLVIIVATIMGFIAAHIATKRGMKGEGFWWGFCLGVVGIIVMRCCPKY
ncbi:MAG: hypothetical protein MJ110_07065 [Lachnospiraceae bacterium]|nr:hypothetical protein [Lachnospiraceae bacterium]